MASAKPPALSRQWCQRMFMKLTGFPLQLITQLVMYCAMYARGSGQAIQNGTRDSFTREIERNMDIVLHLEHFGCRLFAKHRAEKD